MINILKRVPAPYVFIDYMCVFDLVSREEKLFANKFMVLQPRIYEKLI